MIKISNSMIPIKGFAELTIWPFLFFRETLTPKIMRHANIHKRQQFELLLVGFWILYPILCLIHGYGNTCFEREAYEHEADPNYLKTRKAYSMWRKTPTK